MSVIALLSGSLSAVEKQVTSPDGKLIVTVTDDGAKASYSVQLNGKQFLLKSPLGLVTNIGDFSEGLTLSENVKIEPIRDSYSLPNLKFSQINYSANQGVFTFSNSRGPVFDVVFNVSNNDIAFKYVLAKNRKLSCTVSEEKTGFCFPDGTTTFLCPQMRPMTGFAGTAPSYETSYQCDAKMGENAGGLGYTFPCLFHEADGWVMVCETGVSSAYCASRLAGGKGSLYTIAYPLEAENNGMGSPAPGITVPGETPWRTITLGETLAPIVETTVMWDVVKPMYEPSKKYEYGKSTWSWIIRMDASCNYKEQKEYIDFSAALGYQYVLVDALWDENIGRDKIEELAAYAKTKNVGLLLWYNSNGYWNDAPQGPRNCMWNSIARHKEMKWLQSIGIKGLKIDFWGGDKQQSIQLYEDILADANEYGLMLVFHGCTIPRGWERMYPNFASAEAVRASENLSFGQQACDDEALNGCLHPFLRNSIGNMDFGGSALNKRYSTGNDRGTYRRTSDVYALATAVLFQSCIQHFALAPNNLTDAPAWALDFMKSVPTTWDEVKYIDGYPGKYIILARRHADKWYVVGINAQKEPLTVKTVLPMFESGVTLTQYSDTDPRLLSSKKGQVALDEKNVELLGEKKQIKLNKKKEFTWTIPCNGGEVLVSE